MDTTVEQGQQVTACIILQVSGGGNLAGSPAGWKQVIFKRWVVVSGCDQTNEELVHELSEHYD